MRIMRVGRGLTMKEALGMTYKELSTINLLLEGKTQKEIAYLEQVSEAAAAKAGKTVSRFLLDLAIGREDEQ